MVHQEAGPAADPLGVVPTPDRTSSDPLEGLSGIQRKKMREHLRYVARKRDEEERTAAMSPRAAKRHKDNRKRQSRERVATSRENSKRIKARNAK